MDPRIDAIEAEMRVYAEAKRNGLRMVVGWQWEDGHRTRVYTVHNMTRDEQGRPQWTAEQKEKQK